MERDTVAAAFRVEAQRVSDAVAGESEATFAAVSPCPPWTLGELLFHVRIGAARVPAMLAEPEPAAGPLVPAAHYYQSGHRFDSATNLERIAAAQRGAAALGSAQAIAREFGEAWRETWRLAITARPARLVRTRHGDRMLLTEFLRTRVLELAVHGLDLAAGLGRPPWTTEAAARVVEELVLSGGTAGDLMDEASWDHATLIAKCTGRCPATASEARLLERHGLSRLALS